MLLSYLAWSSLGILIVGLLSGVPLWVVAQDTNVVCQAQFDWMDNSRHQNPCLVAAYVQSVCSNGQWTVLSLSPGTHYAGPYADQANACECNSVTYNLVAACSICQNATWISWSSWTFNCSAIAFGYPEDIPSGTAIPNWAYQDVTTTDNFNVTLAQSVGDAPESTATKAQTTANGVSAGAVSASLTALPTVTPSPFSSKPSDVGAIAGGVVGGIVGLAALAALGIWFFKRGRRTISSPSPLMSQHDLSDGIDSAALKLYDPSDPSTFPPSSSPHSSVSFPVIMFPPDDSRGEYTGLPEL